MEAFIGTMFPDPHPYHTTPLGVMSELKSTTLDDLRSFFATYYVPNNATLTLTGDFTAAEARKLVERYFGGIPRAAAVKHPTAPTTPLKSEVRVALEDQRGNTQQLWMGWRGASSTSPDRMALTALSAILSEGPTSRVARALVNDRKLASSVPRGVNINVDLETAGFLQVVIVAAPNASMTAIEQVVDSVVADARNTAPRPEELRRWLARYSVTSITSTQLDLSKADRLGEGETIYRTPAVLSNDIDEARRLRPADIQRVAKKYLTPERVVMSIVPAGKLDLVSKPNEPFTNLTRKP
jgi:zinc protease